MNKALYEIKQTLPKANILLACVCVRGEENLPKDVKKSFMVLIYQEKNYLFILGN